MIKGSKKMLTIILFVIFLLALTTCVVINLPQFGKLPSGARLERIKRSPQWKEGKFNNELETVTMTGDKNLFQAMWSFVFDKAPDVEPKDSVPVIKTDLHKLEKDENLIVWFGHSSYLFQLAGKRILVDPVFYAAAPFGFAGKAFKGSEAYHPEDMPDIDFLVITHNHYDHLDYKTVKELKQKVKHVVCPLGVGEDFEYWGYDAGIVTEMDWWDRKAFADGIVFNCTPARHFSGRKLFDNAKTLWASFVIEKDSTNVFIGGDSGYSGHFKKISEKFGHIDLAFMENGQYNQDWNQIHTMPEEMVKEATELHASLIFSVHYGKFALARHSWDEPYRNIEKIRQAGFTVVKGTIGEVVKY
jgi:L-ascorbate metabolism protein UlaG (beta-lactamase superfamily)